MIENPNMTTMTEIQCFSHTLHNRDISVSAVMINGEPWFCAKDVALALRYANPVKQYCTMSMSKIANNSKISK